VLVTHEHDIAEYAKRQVHLRDGVVERDFLNGHVHHVGAEA
jgi:ABC-type lipoprotein export system ATPase subunit